MAMKKCMVWFILLFWGTAFVSFIPQDTAPRKIKFNYFSYLACSDLSEGFIAKAQFDSMIALPLCARDTNKNVMTLQSFEITYAERGLYQDSTGLPIIFTDYISDRFKGNQITKYWIDLFKERSYKGDTVYIDNVKVLGPDNKSFVCKGMKWVIQ